ncbi:MAG: type II toxin-antitoxin system VapC family toxin [Candidatus Margulisbacteria bacterium]|jgi:PIN domain nuclease of toxin-antitoxin system|nr:type II toxin-antitoxin system VapC family toxin [Candidatus Margulisiibacteriota bacterium]
MNYLLDTHVLIWAMHEIPRLSNAAQQIISSRSNNVLVSVVSFWELAIKTRLEKFSIKKTNIKDIPQYARDMGLAIWDLQERDAISFLDLPLKENHKDPFDRMLIWQAINNNLTLLSKDKLFQQYAADGLKLLW